jgi:Flp pilus assembly protein TadD
VPTVVCYDCGVESLLKSAFHPQARTFRKPLLICPACAHKHRTKVYRVVFVVNCVAAIGGLIAWWFSGNSSDWPMALGLIGFYSIVATALHECGHAIGALLAGQRLFTISVGSYGRMLVSRRFFGCHFILRSIPFGGLTMTASKTKRFARLGRFVMVVCGPLAQVATIAIALLILQRHPHNPAIVGGLVAVIGMDSLLLIGSLIPMKVRVGELLMPTDGLQLLTLPFTKRKDVDQWHAIWFFLEGLESRELNRPDEALDWFDRGLALYPNQLHLRLGRGIALLGLERNSEAREAFLAALQIEPREPATEALLWNNIAWSDLMVGSPELRAEADRLSQQAFEHIGWVAAVQGTRGSVLVETGDLDRGLALLERAFAENVEDSSKALNACYLAMALARKQQPAAAREHLQQARELHAQCPLLPRAEQELASAERSQVGDAQPMVAG